MKIPDSLKYWSSNEDRVTVNEVGLRKVLAEVERLRGALEKLDRQSNNLYCCHHRKMGKVHTHDCYVGKAIAPSAPQ